MNTFTQTAGPILSGHDLADAAAQLLELDAAIEIIPAASRNTLVATIDHLLKRADGLNLLTLRQVLDNSKGLIAAASGVRRAALLQYLTAEDAASAHLHRNVLLAIVLVGSRSTFNKRDAERLAAEFPVLKQRSTGYTRPYTDDETLLLRAWAIVLSETGGAHGRRAAAVYAQCDAGLCAGETTRVRAEDLDLTQDDNSLLHAPGLNTGVAARVIELNTFNATVMNTFISQVILMPKDKLTYWARSSTYDYPSACVAAIGIIDRQRKAVGLKHGDTTNASVTMWRAQYTEDNEGVDAAVAVSGRTNATNHFGLMRTRLNPIQTKARNEKAVPISF